MLNSQKVILILDEDISLIFMLLGSKFGTSKHDVLRVVIS